MRVAIWLRLLVAVVVGVCLGSGVLASAAFAEGEVPWWHVVASVAPTNLPAGGTGRIVVAATDLGDANADGSGVPITVSDRLPAGIVAIGISSGVGPLGLFGRGECSLEKVSCTFSGAVQPYEDADVELTVRVLAGAQSGAVNEAVAEGGGASRVVTRQPFAVGGGATPFGVEWFEQTPEGVGGVVDTQAGSHPFQLTATLDLNKTLEGGVMSTPALVRDLQFNLPAGLVGNPNAIAQCTSAEFSDRIEPGYNACPLDTVIGVSKVFLQTIFSPEPLEVTVPLFNLVPEPGEPARFGFEAVNVPVILDTAVRTGGDYGVVVNINKISQYTDLLASQVTFWGDPADPRHNQQRGWNCGATADLFGHGPCEALNEPNPQPLITMPTSCETPWSPTVTTDSWLEPTVQRKAEYVLHDQFGSPLGLTGCNRLTFEPSVSFTPDGQEGSEPTGLTVGIHVPQTAGLNPLGDAQATVKNTTVTLPAGVALNPAAADGLSACTMEAVGLDSPAPISCPESAKIATVEIHSPLLPDPLVGAAYLATQDSNPFGSLVAMYIVAEDAKAGVLVKLAGEVKLDPVTGQIVATFRETPQLPFEDLALNFFGGSRAPLGTPALCGGYTTTASIEPWSGTEPIDSSSEFTINSGPNHTPCSNPLPFHPTLEAGSTNIQTGGYTQLTTTMSREDGEQNLQAIQLHFPEGLIGSLSQVKLCGEPEADTGTCGSESQIGETTVSVGLGSNPYAVVGGKVYITGPYDGAPFGLSIVNPAKAGPFDLGNVVVRAKVEVNPITAALTVTTDPSGPYAIPRILDGIPLEIKHVNVLINRSKFVFNPSNCTPTAITATLSSSEGTSSNISVPFQVTNCATLKFKPKFAVSTPGKTSRTNGTSLDVKLTYPVEEGQANIAKVKVDLPKQLPSRLPTLQKACTEAVFDRNPEACPAISRVGEAVATTPTISGLFTGPAYFVSHGGAAWPELIVVLKGEDGVTVDLHGETFISKKGVTSSTFSTIPDVPVGSFELKLPAGQYSALTANGANLCGKALVMPTEFVAQNGDVIRQNTKIATTGCPKVKKAHKQAARKKKRGKGAHGEGKRTNRKG
jgi:hypothetical protein